MVHKTFILRQLTGANRQAAIFILCVALSMVTLVALTGFGESINRALLKDARALHAGDIIIRSGYEFAPPLSEQIANLEKRGLVESTRTYEFYSVVRAPSEDASLLANLKVIEPGYPLYGQVDLASGRPFGQALAGGQIIVEQVLLDRLGLKTGDSLKVGQATLTIRDVVLREPDRPVNFFSFGPRVFISIQDLAALDLIKEGSRVRYTTLLKVQNENQLEALTRQLQAIADPDQVEVETFRTAESGVKRFFDDFLFFLSLIGIFTLLLAGIGIQSALTALLREQDKTVAIVKSLGATGRFITVHYLWVVAILGLAGTVLGLAFGLLLQGFFPHLFRSFLPPNVNLSISLQAIIESLLLGSVVVGSFTILPLYRLEEFKPSFIFRKEIAPLRKGWPYYLILSLTFLFFVGLVLWELRDMIVGLYFVGGVIALILITALITELTLVALKRTAFAHLPDAQALAARQALRGLFRPGNATRPIIITLAASLAVIFAIFLIERNLDATFIQSYPEDAPNLFFLDIQPDQVEPFGAALNIETIYYPVVRGNITAINDRTIERQAAEDEDEESLARPFSLTYRDALLEDETLQTGDRLFRPDWQEAQVSILDDILELHPFQVGDVITFKIQGVPLKARIASIRAAREDSVQPIFSFVFPEAVLKDLPQTVFTAITVDKSQIAPLQNKIVARFPNISVIDVTEAIAAFGEVVRKISRIIRFFTLFSILAGVLIIVSSIFATRFARIQEAVYFKVLGATGRFVLQVFALENIFLGLLSALLGVLLSQIGSWIITVQVFEIDYRPFLGASLVMVLVTILLVTSVGMLASISILKQKPIAFLREQNET